MDTLDDLLLEWEEGKERGTPVSPDDLCQGDPALAGRLAARIRHIEACDRLIYDSDSQPGAGTTDPAWIGKYEVRRLIGVGGMGVVYEGWDPDLRRAVAVKIIHPYRLVTACLQAEAQLTREGWVLAQLDHKNIVPVYESGVYQGYPYLVMKFVPGGSLADHRGRLTAAGQTAILPLMEKVARAVQIAHDQGVLHRDLKPGNVLLNGADDPLVADFGLAKLRILHDSSLVQPAGNEHTRPEGSMDATIDGLRPGTPAYMAPEQRDPAVGSVGPWTDVWAMGVMLHELLTGSRPVPQTTRTGDEPTPDRAQQMPRLPTRLATIMGRCLMSDPSHRYQTAGELATALGRVVRPRRRKMMLAVVGVALVVVCTVCVRSVDWGEWRYLRHVADINRKLAQEETVRVVDPGRPERSTYRVREGQEATRVRRTATGMRVESNTDCSLVEFLALSPNVDYTIHATIQLERVLSDKCAWGVYFNHQEHENENGRRQHTYELAGFSEQHGRTDKTRALMSLWLFSAPPPDSDGPVQDSRFDTLPPQTVLLPLNEGGLTQPREITVSVRMNSVYAEFVQNTRPSAVRLGPLGGSDRAMFRRVLASDYGGRYEPSEASVRLGVFARQCTCTVLQLTVSTPPRTQE